MNNKMAKNTYQQLNLKNKLSKQEEQRENHKSSKKSSYLPMEGGGRVA